MDADGNNQVKAQAIALCRVLQSKRSEDAALYDAAARTMDTSVKRFVQVTEVEELIGKLLLAELMETPVDNLYQRLQRFITQMEDTLHFMTLLNRRVTRPFSTLSKSPQFYELKRNMPGSLDSPGDERVFVLLVKAILLTDAELYAFWTGDFRMSTPPTPERDSKKRRLDD